MNKKQLAHVLAKRSKSSTLPMSRDTARLYIDLLFEILSEELSQASGYLIIEHFGKLSVDRRIKRGRAGLLRQGNSDSLSPASRISYHFSFQPSASLKRRLKQNLFLNKYKED